MTHRIQLLLEGHCALRETFRKTPRTIQRLMKRAANRAGISRPVTPHALRGISPR